ncbi:MAG: CARDB domain-containing protein [Candidatus Thermoplasmatota archaeon]|nr:CARDB domain-containing protein [Candidatus Thermoplasmatota archaeon]
MVAAASRVATRRKLRSVVSVTLLIAMSLSYMVFNEAPVDKEYPENSAKMMTTGENVAVWTDGGQPWPQFGRTGSRDADVPGHEPSGGAGYGDPSNASSLMSIIEPSVNWAYGSYSIGTDSLATPIADFGGSINIDEGAEQRCGGRSLFTILVQTVEVSGSPHSILRIIEGEDADLAWQVDIGSTEAIKASPVVVDVDSDGQPEIFLVYDAAGSMHVDAWSPRLSCSVTGWSPNGHSDEKLWTWTDESLMISSDEGPYSNSLLGGHKPTTQPLLADVDLNGDAELVIAALDEVSEEPVVLALPLQTNGTPNSMWQVNLDKGSHPSDPAFAQMDESTGFIVLTTIEASNGAMWVWKIDSETGGSSWDDGLPLNNLDGDTNSPHIRLPGPVIANLDSDSDPEMIITIPSDADGSGNVDGAEFRGMEIGDGSELWTFEASNGFADAPPTAIDTDEDGEHDRVCWVTWWQSTTGARHGVSGCHDVGGASPNEAWNRDLEQSSGTPNDEIAVAAASWMNIDDEGEPELIVPFGRSLWAFDGSTGTSAGINSAWSEDLELEHRTWSSPSLADVDGDAALDVVIGSTVVSMSMADVRPLTDGRGIEFNPSAPDPDEEVTVTAYIENAGTSDTDDFTDATLYANGVEIGSRSIANLEPVDPSGTGSFSSFSVEWSGGLGEHTFELILDPYRNLTQTRYDNDFQTKTLSIIPTYNATFEIPTEPVRVDPGSSEDASVAIRSTGRLSGTWSLSVDDSTLPSGWWWVDNTPGGISSVEIGAGERWFPELRIHAPSDALGSDSGFLGLTLSLDGGNTSANANLPIEANRTRGLSIRGSDGTSSSDGFGLISEDASAWLLIENVGNAAENQIAISWDGTEWGSDLRIFDSSDQEITALSLGPGEIKEVTARLGVPQSANLGDSVNTPLTMCVGSGEEEECSQVDLGFFAAGVVVRTDHQRSVPEEVLAWEVHADIPEGTSNLSWSLAGSGMSIQGWTWESSGSISISGDNVSLTGSPGTRASGWIFLDLPEDATPAFHQFFDGSTSGTDFALRLSLEVLQIHRAALEVNSPVSQPYVVDVGEPSLVILRLENSGNGDDSYILAHQLIFDENITSDPGISVSFSSNPISLGPGALRTVPLSVTLPEDTPARIPISINFSMTSVGNGSVSDSKVVVFEVRQDHRWEITTTQGGVEVNGSTFSALPGEEMTFAFNATNTGNLVDDIEFEIGTRFFVEEGDQPDGWGASGSSAVDVSVNQTVAMEVFANVSDEAWSGSTMEVEVIVSARGFEVMSFTFFVQASHVPGWGVASSKADLEIEPEGSIVELEILQYGNSPSSPYVSVYVTGQNGWEIEPLAEMGEVEPGSSTTLLLNITPPESATHGKSVELHVRVREGDSSGLVEITLPIRVAIVHDFTMDGEGAWVISSHGGLPQVKVSNLGNSPTTIELQILSLPPGWEVEGSSEVVLGIGEERGVPISLVPDEDWSGDEKTIRILAQDPAGNQQEIILNAVQSEYSWASSPYISALVGDDATVMIYGTDSSSSVVQSSGTGELQFSSMGWLLPISSSGTGNLIIDGTSSLQYEVSAFEGGVRVVLCQISGEVTEIQATCTIGNGSDEFDFQAFLIGDEGQMIDSAIGSLSANSSTLVNLSSDSWEPYPGKRKIGIRVLDDKGRMVGDAERTYDIRRSDWNVGLVGLELEGEGEGQKVKVLTKRLNENLLEDADCIITISSGTHHSEHVVDMTQTFVPSPLLDRPDVDDEQELVATIGCAFPWDQDSDPSDDVASLILSGGNSVTDGLSNFNTGAMAAILVVGIYIGLAWIVSNYRERERMISLTQAAIEEKMAERASEESPEDEVPDSDEEVSPRGSEEGEEVELVEEEEGEVDEFEDRLRRLLDR